MDETLMRAALLPIFAGERDVVSMNHTVGMWMRQYQRWQHVIDRLVIDHNDESHGRSLNRMVTGLDPKYEYILLVEQDAVILNPDYVEECFKLIESGEYDCVGSPRMSCHAQLAEAAKKKWALDYSGYGDKGPNFWPNFFFCRRSDLMRTDLNFGTCGWKPGDYIDILEHTVTDEKIGGDTFVWMSLQLRNLCLRFKEVPQYHSSPEDIQNSASGTGLWDKKCPWFHMGSISGFFHHPSTKMESMELERRAAWHELSGMDMSLVIEKFRLNRGRVDQFKDIYQRLIK